VRAIVALLAIACTAPDDAQRPPPGSYDRVFDDPVGTLGPVHIRTAHHHVRLDVPGADVVAVQLYGQWQLRRRNAAGGVDILPLAVGEYAEPAGVADLDGDGRDDLVLFSGHLEAFDATTGQLVWSSPLQRYPHKAEVADLDGDGVPEILSVVSGQIGLEVEARTLGGVLLATRLASGPEFHLAQLDGDPELEVLGLGTVYEGSTLTVDGARDRGLFRGACDVDGDGDEELLVTNPAVSVWDGNRRLWGRSLDLYTSDPVAFADLDGDGTCEAVLGRDGVGFGVVDGLTGALRDWLPPPRATASTCCRRTWTATASTSSSAGPPTAGWTWTVAPPSTSASSVPSRTWRSTTSTATASTRWSGSTRTS
jgi:hypothetical protein